MLGRRVIVYLLFTIITISTIAVPISVNAEVKGIPRTQDTGICPVIESTNTKESPTKVTMKVNVPSYKGVHIAAAVTPAVSTPTPQTQAITESSSKPPSMSSDLLMQLINDHRKSMGLHEYQKEDRLCALARARGPELAGETASGNIHGGLYGRNLPYWITENMKYGTGTEQDFFNWWLGSDIHRKAIEGDFTYSCGECYGNACIQLFTSYTPK